MPFDEKTVLDQCIDYIKNDFHLVDLKVFHSEDENAADPMNRKKDAKPGKPAFYAYAD